MRISDWSSDVCSSDLKAVKRGEVAFFAPPSNALVHAHFGAEPPVFGKIVYGLPGDIVTHRGADVVVSWAAGAGNEAPSEQLVAKLTPVSSAGEELEPGPTGVNPHGRYFKIGRGVWRGSVGQNVANWGAGGTVQKKIHTKKNK